MKKITIACQLPARVFLCHTVTYSVLLTYMLNAADALHISLERYQHEH